MTAPCKYRVLRYIMSNPGCTAREIVHDLDINRVTVQKRTRDLMDEGLVTGEVCPSAMRTNRPCYRFTATEGRE